MKNLRFANLCGAGVVSREKITLISPSPKTSSFSLHSSHAANCCHSSISHFLNYSLHEFIYTNSLILVLWGVSYGR